MGNASKPTLRMLAQKAWEGSGITDAQARKLHWEPVPAEDVKKLDSRFHAAGALKLPYFDEKGKLTKFFRIRYLEPLPGFAGQAEKPQRYDQPRGSLNEIYLPPLLDRSWAEVLADPHEDVVITEGEKKAASACAHGIATLGLGGVDVWRARARGLELLPTLAGATWANRNVTVVYDSDLADNPDVLRAQNQLARALLGLGARVRVTYVTPGDSGAKRGLDDLIVAEGADALRALIEEAGHPSEALALHEMNAEVALISNPGVIVVQETGQLISRDQFVSLHYAHRSFEREAGAREGRPSFKTCRTAPEWIAWPHRNTFHRLAYRPGQPTIVERQTKKGTLERYFNTWRGWGVEPKEGPVELWTELLDHLFKGARRERQWFERWCAYPLQHPGTKLFSAAVLWSAKKGVGKSITGECLRLIYGDGEGGNAVLIDQNSLQGSFNSALLNRQFVHGDEITGSDNRTYADKLKGYITNERIRINEKFLPEFETDFCANFFFTSNHPDAFFLEDGDRRYFIHEVTGSPLPFSYYERLRQWKAGEGAAALFHHLLHLDLGDFQPRAPALETAAKTEMLRDAKSDVGRWIFDLKETGSAPGLAKDCDLFTAEELLKAYDREERGKVKSGRIGTELKAAQFPKNRVRVGTEVLRLWAVRNHEEWAALATEKAADREKWIEHRRANGPKSPKKKF